VTAEETAGATAESSVAGTWGVMAQKSGMKPLMWIASFATS